MVVGLGLVMAVPRARAPETVAAAVPAAVPAALATGAPLRIETVPAGASVWLDDAALGNAPVDSPDLPPGLHRVRVARQGYAPAELTLEMQPGTTPPPLQFVMTPLATLAPAVVASAPPSPRPSRTGVAATAPSAATGALLPAWVHDLERDPTITRPWRKIGARAPYPEAAQRLRFGGTVDVEMVVTERGETTDIRVLHGAGDVLDRAVVETVRGWRFEPARKDGRPVRVRWRYSQTFNPSA